MKTFDRESRRAFVLLHACVFLWGLTAILGRLIMLPAIQIVAWRMALVALLLAAFPRTWRAVNAMSLRSRIRCAGIGGIVAAHWLCFYASIKIANASVAVACLGIAPVFAAFFEPLVTHRPRQRGELVLGAVAVPGVVLIAGGVPLEMRLGLLVGMVAAVLGAVFTTLNKRFAAAEDPFAATAIEMASGTFLLGIPAWSGGTQLPTPQDWAFLLVLALLCTLVPFVIWLWSLRYVTAVGTLLILNLEPVYAVLLAAVFFQEYEQLSPQFYTGTALVLVTVLFQSRLRSIAAACQ